MFGEFTPLEQTRAYQEIAEKVHQEGLKEGLKEGRQEGLKEGLKKGRQEEAAQLVRRQLKRRLGRLSPTQQKKVKAMSVEQLEQLGDALLDFECPADLTAWLRANWKPPEKD